MTNKELIAALEAADGPSRELDWQIAVAFGVKQAKDRPAIWAGVDQIIFVQDLPHYTSSIDAALMLVPEGFAWGVASISADGDETPGAMIAKEVHADVAFMAKAATPALAICIAAIKAGGEG